MAATKDTRKVYNIPQNFIDESRTLNGMVVTRNFVEGLILAAIVALFAWQIPVSKVQTKITVMIAICAPFFLLGVAGINGDPLSVFVRNMMSWRKNRSIMLYNAESRALAQSSLDTMMERPATGDMIIDFVNKFHAARAARDWDSQLVEGVTFEFEADPELSGHYLTDDKPTGAASQKNKKKNRKEAAQKTKQPANSDGAFSMNVQEVNGEFETDFLPDDLIESVVISEEEEFGETLNLLHLDPERTINWDDEDLI